MTSSDGFAETWRHVLPAAPGRHQFVEVTPEGERANIAVLHWFTCPECRWGYIAQIRVNDGYRRHGLAGRMLRYAMTGCDGYTWTSTWQSADGKAFFRGFARATGTAAIVFDGKCPHIDRPGATDYGGSVTVETPPAPLPRRRWWRRPRLMSADR